MLASSIRAATAFGTLIVTTLLGVQACGSAQQLAQEGGSSTCATECEQQIANCGDASSIPAAVGCGKFCAMTPPDDQSKCLGRTSCAGLGEVLELGGCCQSSSFDTSGTGSAIEECVSFCTGVNRSCTQPFCGGPLFPDGGAAADGAAMDCMSLCEKNPTAAQNCLLHTACPSLAQQLGSTGTVCGL